MKKILVIQGSPRKSGNTKQFSDPMSDVLRAAGADVREVWLYDYEIKPCLSCKNCQKAEGVFGCVLKDDMQELFDLTLASDLVVFSMPIYAFFAPAPMKAYMDRLIYASGKYYGGKRLPSLLRGKKCAILATCGYPPKIALPMFEDAIKLVCKHLGMQYLGSAAAVDAGGDTVFMTEQKAEDARRFARALLEQLSDRPGGSGI